MRVSCRRFSGSVARLKDRSIFERPKVSPPSTYDDINPRLTEQQIKDTTFDPPSETEIEQSNRFFRGGCKFVKMANYLSDVPEMDLHHVAFAGRSNVGKSSLLNSVIFSKDLVKTSSTPGSTQTINFFLANNRLMLVDLPGYGYAAASKSSSVRWNELVKAYMEKSDKLRRVFLLIDSRLGVTPLDSAWMDMMDLSGVGYQIILTKIDKVGTTHVDDLATKVKHFVINKPCCFPLVLSTSSQDKTGIDELRVAILKSVGL